MPTRTQLECAMPKTKAADLPDTVEFNREVKHGTHRLHKRLVARFEDPDAAPYFVRAGWAEFTDKEPDVTFTEGEVEIDPETIMGNNGPDGTSPGLLVKDIEVTNG